ncbi:MAG: hypothetical protein ACRECZ_00580 [Methylocella sp.]
MPGAGCAPGPRWDLASAAGLRNGHGDAEGFEASAAEFAMRSVKRGSKRFALELAVRSI